MSKSVTLSDNDRTITNSGSYVKGNIFGVSFITQNKSWSIFVILAQSINGDSE